MRCFWERGCSRGKGRKVTLKSQTIAQYGLLRRKLTPSQLKPVCTPGMFSSPRKEINTPLTLSSASLTNFPVRSPNHPVSFLQHVRLDVFCRPNSALLGDTCTNTLHSGVWVRLIPPQCLHIAMGGQAATAPYPLLCGLS